jgi:DNA replication protein DnaC
MLEAGVPLRHIDNFGALRETAALKIVREWGMRGFLVLTGPPGTGKSFAAACAVRKFLESRILPDRLDRAARKSAETVRALKSVMWYGADEIAGDKTAASRARDRPLVVIDDLGGEGGTFERQNAIRGIISKRYDSKLSTVVTTGLTMPDIRDRYGRYIAERLIEDVPHGGKVVVCGEVSVRLNVISN